MNNTVTLIRNVLKENSAPEAIAQQKKVMPGITEKVYGVKMPVLNALARQYKHLGFDLAAKLWKAGSLEEKLLAVKLLGAIAKKDPERSLQLVQEFAKGISNWAICDAIGMQALKPIVKTHQAEIFTLAKQYNCSPDYWQRRLSLVLVEWYTRVKALHPEIKQLIKALENDKEYYVKKAVIWIRRNFEKNK